ncbi:MAG: hypothetical protein KJO58_10615, partial [Gammaproteobacteria bacterium]|nr:hypothetical protein [Gammaproteobacteria bacterium]
LIEKKSAQDDDHGRQGNALPFWKLGKVHLESIIPRPKKKRPKPLTFLYSIIGFVNCCCCLASPNRMVEKFILLEPLCVKLTQR